MVRQGKPETVPKNCGTAGRSGVFSDSIVTCFTFSHHSFPSLLNLSVLSLYFCDASLNGEAVELGGKEARA